MSMASPSYAVGGTFAPPATTHEHRTTGVHGNKSQTHAFQSLVLLSVIIASTLGKVMAAAPQAPMFFNVMPVVASVASSSDEQEEIKVIVERNVPVPMRDGTILRADVHRPDRGGPYPVLVKRTPYGKGGNFDRFVKAGYIVVSQDVRGRYESDGKWNSLFREQTQEAKDGYDTVEWAARLPGSTGKVGTFGISYPAFLQWCLAPLRPPALVVMSACSNPAKIWDLSPSTIRPGSRLWWWRNLMASDMLRKSNIPGIHTKKWETTKLWDEGESAKWIYWLPWLELPPDLFGYEAQAVKSWLANPHVDPWSFDEGCKDITLPNLDIVGWYDEYHGDMSLFRAMVNDAATETARKGSKIIVGPWSHASVGRSRVGDIDFGPDAALDLISVRVRWFDYWLKGVQNGVDKDAPVKIFVMGDNKWRDEQQWPLQGSKNKILFITSGGHANASPGDGRLIDGKPLQLVTDQYTYDPRNPVPSLYSGMDPKPKDQRPLTSREDILIYQTEPLVERVEVTGYPVVELYASSSAADTDWFVRLIDVAPDGFAMDVSMGLVRARYRGGFDKPGLLKLGEVVKYIIHMRPTSNAFLPGHRIRLDITSSDFPNYDRNHNTAVNQNTDATLVVANQTIYHGGEKVTRIILPWVPNPPKPKEEKPAEEEKVVHEPEKPAYPLHQAAASGHIEQLRMLISKGTNINSEDEDKNTPLCSAVKSENIEVIRILVEAGADVNVGSRPPLRISVDKNNIAIAKYLIDHGSNIEASGWSALRYAPGIKNNIEMIKLLIAKGADINVGPWTPLHGAVYHRRRDIAEFLIRKGADINAKERNGLTPLSLAIQRNNEEIAELLIANGAKIEDLNLEDLNSKDERGLTVLHNAAVEGYQEIAEILLSKGAKVDERDDNYEFTALHYAARFGSTKVAEVLIAHGADIKAKDKWAYEPIHWAAYHDRPEIIELLIAKGADVNVKTSLGQTSLELAIPRRNTGAIRVLLKHGAKEPEKTSSEANPAERRSGKYDRF